MSKKGIVVVEEEEEEGDGKEEKKHNDEEQKEKVGIRSPKCCLQVTAHPEYSVTDRPHR